MRQLILLLFYTILGFSQQINVKNFGAKGDGQSDDTAAFTIALSEINKKYSLQKKHVILYVPSGEYVITKPILLNKYISLEGEFVNSTSIKINSTSCEGILLEENKTEKDIYNGYNTIKNISILGPDFNKNPFAWKDVKLNNPKSVGIKILGLRNRIENCLIDGFLWSGIEITSSYYNFLSHNFIKNNRIGITIDKTSTSTYINNNEIRTNAIGILISNQSYANFINNNIVESNISNFLEPQKNDEDHNLFTSGKGILIYKSNTNFIQNNYFEQQTINYVIAESNANEFSSNFIALQTTNSKNQSIVRFYGKSNDNTLLSNKTVAATPEVDATKIILSETDDYSSNTIDFGKEKNKIIKNKFEKNNKNQKFIPTFLN
ncbi:glycosyl hydrolase family 28-related protein [Flavobacterium restrictum]|uniref:Rhamnogalacturonase A/B/Epimerase-like pectate lyase domain-containing protein n=1 Tax=Flavobacterium restrictum TaxID=2594428 RepID=A0A553E5A3_9FLAO|nr:glycosyl hydrolase family 28-related protein [Flavobacterium restrictum]TRX40142.1 hypothetical protein FNW21_08015 [Flavobacterium restrictum]